MKKKQFLPLALMLTLFVPPAHAAESKDKPAPRTKHRAAASVHAASPAAPMPQLAFEKSTLPNGLQLILHVDRKLPVVHVNQWFHVGSKNEKPGRTGFAHLFEHMMFQGSKNAKGKYFVYAEKAGANLFEGGVDGTTNHDRTNYFITTPSTNLESVLWLESDRLATLTEGLTKEKLDNQRDVVKNERRQSLENQPYGRAFKLITENLFPAGHPYSWTVIGSHEDITAASMEDVTDFFKTYYTPNNLSLTIAGDFDPAEAKRLVTKYFGGIPAGPALDRPARALANLTSEKVFEVNDRVPQERVYMAWPTPAYFEPGDAAMDLASLILSDGLSARLTKVLVYDKQLCSAVTTSNQSAEIAGNFVVTATARPGSSLAQIEELVTTVLHELARTGPTPAELERAKTKQEYSFVSGLERIGGFGGKSDVLNQYNTFLGDPGKLQDDVLRYRNVSGKDIQEHVGLWLDTRNRLLVRFHPETSGRAEGAALDRTLEPAGGTDKHFTTPVVKVARLQNGIDLFVVERPELPKVAVNIVTRAGSVADPAGKEGVANLTMSSLDLGTPTRKALEIEDAFGDLGTVLSGSAGRESAAVSMEVLKRNLAPALTILSDVVLHPTFPESEIARQKKLLTDTLEQQSINPDSIALRVRSMLLFGREHPYGRPGLGLPSTVSGITRADLEAFHAARYRPGSTAIVFVGDVTLAEAKALAESTFGAWSGAAAPPIAIPAPAPASAGKVYLVDRQDAAQTVVAQILPAPRRNAEEFYALQLVDAVWGGGFNTRLILNLRESKGYSYGAFSSLAGYSSGGYWSAGGGVQTNKTKESIVEFVKELKDLAGDKLVSDKELAEARAVRVRGYAQQFESLGRVAEQVGVLWAQGLPMTELQREVDETERLPLAAVIAAEKKYVIATDARLLLVGDRTKIEAGLRELNLGEIVLLDAEGKPVGKS
ncbi:MAG: pitrilysin family protein [Thermoanaerobaculia bacterium]